MLSIEEFINSKLEKIEVDENEVLDDYNTLLKIMHVVKIKMAEQGLDEKFASFKQAKMDQRKVGQKASHSEKWEY